MTDFDLEKLNEIPDPYRPDRSSRPLPAAVLARSGGSDRSALIRRQWLALLAVLGVEGVWLLQAGVAPRPQVPTWFFIAAFVLPVVGGALALWAARSPGRLGLGWVPRRLAAASAGALGLFVLSGLFTPPAFVDGFTLRSTLLCGGLSVFLAGLPFMIGALAFRRSLAGYAGWRMTGVGAACGCLAAAVLRVHCPLDSAPHVLVAHGIGIALFALIGSWIGSVRFGGMRV